MSFDDRVERVLLTGGERLSGRAVLVVALALCLVVGPGTPLVSRLLFPSPLTSLSMAMVNFNGAFWAALVLLAWFVVRPRFASADSPC